MAKTVDYKIKLDMEETFPKQLLFMRTEEITKYEDGKKTDIVEGYKVFVMDMNSMSEVSIKVMGKVGELKQMQPVHFEGVEVVPYIKRNGNFSNLEYSVKAQSVSQA